MKTSNGTNIADECVLCDVLENEEYRIILKNEFVAVLVNIEPLKEGHLMVLPRRHTENLADLHADESQAFLGAVDTCMNALAKKYEHVPMCIVNGWGNRSQRHLHAHVLPSKNDIRKIFVASEGCPERVRASKEQLAEIANIIRPFIQ